MPGRLLRMGLPILGLATAMLSRLGYIPFGLIPPSDESVGKYPSEGAVRVFHVLQPLSLSPDCVSVIPV